MTACRGCEGAGARVRLEHGFELVRVGGRGGRGKAKHESAQGQLGAIQSFQGAQRVSTAEADRHHEAPRGFLALLFTLGLPAALCKLCAVHWAVTHQRPLLRLSDACPAHERRVRTLHTPHVSCGWPESPSPVFVPSVFVPYICIHVCVCVYVCM